MNNTIDITTQADAIAEMASRGRDIITVRLATAICEPFDTTPQELGVVYTANAGLDFGSGAERWEDGEMVNVSTLARMLAEHVGAPLVKYGTDYIGAGRRSAAITACACISLDIHLGLLDEHPSCQLCRTYDMRGSGALCFSCSRMVAADYKPEITEHEHTNYASPRGEQVTEFWVNQLGDRRSKTFATREQAEEFVSLMQRAQEHLRAIYA